MKALFTILLLLTLYWTDSHRPKNIRKIASQFTCSDLKTEINLETNSDLFQNIGYDNQGELGTCFAHTAKNLLVGITKGEKDISAFDVGLAQYRDMQSMMRAFKKDFPIDNLDGGTVCGAVEAIQKFGYCPMSNARLEGLKTAEYIQPNGKITTKYKSEILLKLNQFFSTKALLKLKHEQIIPIYHCPQDLLVENCQEVTSLNLNQNTIAILRSHLGIYQFLKKYSPELNLEEKDNATIYQMAIAPECINKDNRESIPENIECKILYFNPSTIDEFQLNIYQSLSQNQPVGSSSFTHANTIVGMRYNEEKQDCEFLMRDAQDPKSRWEPQKKLLEHKRTYQIIQYR